MFIIIPDLVDVPGIRMAIWEGGGRCLERRHLVRQVADERLERLQPCRVDGRAGPGGSAELVGARRRGDGAEERKGGREERGGELHVEVEVREEDGGRRSGCGIGDVACVSRGCDFNYYETCIEPSEEVVVQ